MHPQSLLQLPHPFLLSLSLLIFRGRNLIHTKFGGVSGRNWEPFLFLPAISSVVFCDTICVPRERENDAFPIFSESFHLLSKAC